MKFIKNISYIILSVIATFWRSMIEVVLGIGGIFLMWITLNYFSIEYSFEISKYITSIITINNFLINNWGIFFFAFFALKLYDKLKWELKR